MEVSYARSMKLAQEHSLEGGGKDSFTAQKHSVIHEGELKMKATNPNFPLKPNQLLWVLVLFKWYVHNIISNFQN